MCGQLLSLSFKFHRHFEMPPRRERDRWSREEAKLRIISVNNDLVTHRFVNHALVVPVFNRHQTVVRPQFNNAPFLNNSYIIGISDCAKPMSDNNCRDGFALFQEVVYAALYQHFRLGIERWRGNEIFVFVSNNFLSCCLEIFNYTMKAVMTYLMWLCSEEKKEQVSPWCDFYVAQRKQRDYPSGSGRHHGMREQRS